MSHEEGIRVIKRRRLITTKETRHITPRGGDFGRQAEERYGTRRTGFMRPREDIQHREEKTYNTKRLMTPIGGDI